MGGVPLTFIPVELTYGIERIAMYLQGVDNVYETMWNKNVKYNEIYKENERQFSIYNFEIADTEMLKNLYYTYKREFQSLITKGLYLPGYDYLAKSAHVFNLLDARNAIGVNERHQYILDIRNMAKSCAKLYIESLEEEVIDVE
jgi:glycyl-tRNA synthetase alpha chain